jgi:membrane fusion protein (multidrug efflux system)
MADQQAPGNGRNKKKALMVFGTIVVAGLITAVVYNAYRATHISTDDAFIEGNIYTISARVNGTVKSVLIRDNQPVKKGDLLVELDPADYRSRAGAAQANVELQRANLRFAERERKRAEALYDKEVSSADRYDKAVSAHEIAAAQVRLAEEQLKQAELNLGYTTITAPGDGYVTRKSVQVGNQVQTGQPLMAVVALEDLWIVANYKETQMSQIRPGQEVRIKVDSYPGRMFQGTVDSIMAGTGVSFSLFPAENATGNYVKVVQRIPVKIRFAEGTDKDQVLRVGMSVVPTVLAK